MSYPKTIPKTKSSKNNKYKYGQVPSPVKKWVIGLPGPYLKTYYQTLAKRLEVRDMYTKLRN